MGYASTKAPLLLLLGLRSNASRGSTAIPSAVAPTTLASDRLTCLTQKVDPEREARLIRVKERWLRARPGREVTIVRGGSSRTNDVWEVVLIEDDKAIAAARGESCADALRGALAGLGKLLPDDES